VQVPLNDFRRQWRVIGPSVLGAVERVGASGRYVLGDEVSQFERELANYWGLEHIVGVGNGLDAIEIALRCLGIQPGDRVLTTPLSAFATTLAILRSGGTPVFIDVDEAGLVDLGRCRDLLDRDRRIRFMVPVHLYGHVLDMEELRDLRDSRGLEVVEDCAQCIGASWEGIWAGTVGHASAVSFYPTKNLGALGDAGAVLTVDPDVKTKARALRNYGQTDTYVHKHLGLNSRLDEIHAAILRDALLPNLAKWQGCRAATAEQYISGLANPAIRIPPKPRGSSSVWHLFPIIVDGAEKDGLVSHLRSQGVATGSHYPILIPNQAALADSGGFEVVGELARASEFAAGEVSLPIHPFLTPEEISYVIDACNSWRPR